MIVWVSIDTIPRTAQPADGAVAFAWEPRSSPGDSSPCKGRETLGRAALKFAPGFRATTDGRVVGVQDRAGPGRTSAWHGNSSHRVAAAVLSMRERGGSRAWAAGA